MNRCTHLMPFSVLVLLIAAALSCSNGSSTGRDTKPYEPKAVVVLFDMSESTNDERTRKFYAECFDHIVDSLHPGDAIVGGWITDNSASEPDLPVNRELVEPEKSGRSLYDKAKELEARRKTKEFAEEIRKVMAQALASQPRKIIHTDILGSVEQASRVFKSYPRSRRDLVIVSDMIQDTTEFDFDTENLAPDRITSLVNRLSAERRIPDLMGTVVYAVGARHRDEKRSRMIRDFWMAFFRAAGADLTLERYGPTLIKFEE